MKDVKNQTLSASKGIESIEVGMQILTALAEGGNGGNSQTLKAISERVDMLPSKAHRYLASFLKTNFVVRDAQTNMYRLGPSAIRAGLAALHGNVGVQLAMEIACTLRDRYDQTTIVSIWGERGPVVVHIEDASNSQINVRVGTTLPALSSASGQAFISHLPSNAFESLVRSELKSNVKRRDDRLLSTAESAAKLISSARKNGVGLVRGELSPGIQALAAPILDHDAYPVAAVGISGPISAFNIGLKGEVALHLKKLCMEASESVGYPQHG